MRTLKIKPLDYLIPLVGYFIIALSVLGGILLSPGTIGFFHDWFIGPYPEMNKSFANSGLYLWDPQIGNKVYGTDWIFRLILTTLPFLGGEVLSKGLLLLSMTLAGFGAYCLGRRLKLNPFVSFAAGVIYMFSPIIFTRIVAGYIYYLVAYFLSPLIVEMFLRGKDENRNRDFIIAGLLLSIAVVQIQFLVMVFLILLIFSIVDFKRIKKSMIGLSIIISITFLLTFSPLLLPQLLVKTTEIPFNPTQLLSYFTVSTASDLAKSFRLLGYEGMPYSYLNLGTSRDTLESNAGIMPPWIFYVDFLLPIIGFSVLLFRKDKYTLSFAIISIIGLFLLKGLNPPFSGLFVFLFKHGFYIFREVWHVAFLYGFAMTFLVAFFIERLSQLNFRRSIKVAISVSLISMIAISNGYPLLLGNFAGYLQTYEFPNEYHSLYNKLVSDPHYNVLILPYVNPIRYDNLTLEGLDPLIYHTSTMIFPTILANRASPTLSASTWLLSSMQENMTYNLGKLLSGFGIKYVILRNDFVSNFPKYTPLGSLINFKEKWYTPLEPILASQNDMKLIANNAHYKIYENLNNATKIFSPIVSAGGLSDFDSLLLVSNLTSLSNVALYPSVTDGDSLIFLDDIREADMPVNNFVEIGGYAGTFDAKKGWTNNRLAFGYDHLLASRLKEGAFTSSPNSELSFELPSKYNSSQVEIWMKAVAWNQGGRINIQIDGEKYSVPLFSPDRSIRLFKIFEGQSDIPYHISIQNVHGRNYVEGLYVKEKGFQALNVTNKVFLMNKENERGPNLVANSGFSLVDNQSKLPLNWSDSLGRCGKVFTCKINVKSGWDDNVSFQFSTKRPHNVNGTWSWIYGQEVNVKPSEWYKLITHMKMNFRAQQSNVLLEGFNETSQRWYKIMQCPSGVNGTVEWQEFSCPIRIPENTTKIRPVLNAGWSSDPNRVARTWFDALYLRKQSNESQFHELSQVKKFILPEDVSNKSSSTIANSTTRIGEYNKANPTLWNVHISTTRPTTIAFAEPYDRTWQATVYKDGKKVDVVNSMPLYGVLNAFQVKQTGDLDIVLRFVPQYWYEVGLVISALTFGGCIFYIIYDWRKKREIKS
jgi:hypothetical protein